MDTQTIDQEYEKLEGEFEDVAKTLAGLVSKLQAAAQAGDANAKEWLEDVKLVAQDVSDEQTQAKVLLLAIHAFIRNVAGAQPADAADEKPPLFAPGQEPPPQPQQPQVVYQPVPMGMGMGMGGGMFGGYMGGGFARAMEMGAGMSIGGSLIRSLLG